MEDMKAKERIKNFMDIPVRDHVSQWEQFHVSLRKKRFLIRSNQKRGILFNNYSQNSLDEIAEKSIISSQEAYSNKDYIKFCITEEDIRDFRKEAYQTQVQTKDRKTENIKIVMEHWISQIKVTFKKEPTHSWLQILYGALLRWSIVTSPSIENLVVRDIDTYIPELIKNISVLLDFPEHLKLLLSILISISSMEKVEEDFIYENYKFIPQMQEIFAHYDYHEELFANAYWLIGNLVLYSSKTRNIFLEAKFIDHLVFLFNDKKLELSESTINTLAYTINSFCTPKIENWLMHLPYFDDLIPILDDLLSSKTEDTVRLALMSRYRLTGNNIDPKTQFYKDLCTEKVMKRVLLIFKYSDKLTKHWLKVLWNMTLSEDSKISVLIDNGLWDALIDSRSDPYK